MNARRLPDPRLATLAAGAACATITAFDITGRAARDAIFLSSFRVTALPTMIVAGSIAAITIGWLASLRVRRSDPASMLATTLAVSAAVAVGEALALGSFPRLVAVLLYVHYTALSALLVSGFWIMLFEQFDPRAARRSVPAIAAAGTFGGLLGGLLSVQIASAMPVVAALAALALFNAIGAFAVHQLRRRTGAPAAVRAEDATIAPTVLFPAIAMLRRSHYVRVLLAIAAVTAVGETLVDYVLMARAGATYGSGAALLHFFALFYTATAVVTLLVQVLLTRPLLGRIGVSRAGALLPAGVAAGGAVALGAPGLATAALSRGGEMVLRNSTFRAAYELLFNALRPADKRLVKTTADITAPRTGRIIGSAAIQLLLFADPAHAVTGVLLLLVISSVGALLLFRGLGRAHVATLEGELVARQANASDTIQTGLHTTLMPMSLDGSTTGISRRDAAGTEITPADARAAALRSGNAPEIVAALRLPITSDLVATVIPLLGREDVSRVALRALQAAPADAVHALATALRDPSIDVMIRRRIPFALGAIGTARARDALVRGLDDDRFEVRARCGLVLSKMVAKNPMLAPAKEQVFEAVAREVAVDSKVWDQRRLIPLLPEEREFAVLGEVLKERADRSLAHVFTLLGLVLPAAPLRAAYRSLGSDDAHLRGTALEYLEKVLPASIRRDLWHVLEEDERAHHRTDVDATSELRRAVEANVSMEFEVNKLKGPTKGS